MPKEPIPPGVLIHVHDKGWMDEQGMLLWIKEVWECRPGHLLNKKSCLVFDMFKDHLLDSVKKQLVEGNTDVHVALILAGLTSQLQPLDVSINKPFKDKVRVLWTDWMAGSTDHALTRGGRLKKPSITLWCEWIMKVWNEKLIQLSLTLGAHAPEGYGSCPVCVSVCVCVCLSATLIWGLGLVEV